MFIKIAFFVAFTLFANSATVHSAPESIEKFDAVLKTRFEGAFAQVEGINGADAGWKAQFYPRFARLSPEERRAMNGLKFGDKKTLFKNRPETPIQIRHEDLPEEFDPRKRWPECADVFNNIRDQSRCGDCWAVAAAGVLSDRICIHSKGKLRLSISDIDVASCAASQANEANDGCTGAKTLSPAWDYFHENGAVTGSNYAEQGGCKPYPFLPTKQAKVDYHTPECAKKCTNEKYGREYEQDKIRVGQAISLYSEDWKKVEHLIKQEVFVNGSVEVGFMIYNDFYYYSKGIYKQTSNEKEGGHAVRLVGWGAENGTPYWLIANSWGPEWGENGFFRIQRGTNEAGIEEMATPYTGMPLLTRGDEEGRN